MTKVMDLSMLKANAHKKKKKQGVKKLKYVFGRVEKIVGKEVNAGYQSLLPRG